MSKAEMLDKLAGIEARYEELNRLLAEGGRLSLTLRRVATKIK